MSGILRQISSGNNLILKMASDGVAKSYSAFEVSIKDSVKNNLVEFAMDLIDLIDQSRRNNLLF